MNLYVTDLLSITHRSADTAMLTERKRFHSVSTDTRTIKKNSVFVALKGETYDGHSFINEAAKRGASVAVVSSKWYRSAKRKPRIGYIVVDDTLKAYGELARVYRRKFDIPIIMIGGSNGKTTTKEFAAHVLGTSFNVLKTQANFNNEVGAPQTIFQLTPKHDIAVIEAGTNHPGELQRLVEIVEPTHGLITNIGREHLEFFRGISGVAREELTIFRYLRKNGGILFVNVDEKFLLPFTAAEKNTILYGTKKTAAVSVVSRGYDAKMRQKIEVVSGKKKCTVAIHLTADYAPNLCAAVTAIGMHFGISMTKIINALGSFRPADKRMMILRTGGITIINDTYNANPESFLAALKTLTNIPCKGKRYIAAGDMFELGKESRKEHHQLGAAMKKYRLDGYYFTGKDMRYASEALGSKTAYYFASKDALIDSLRERLRRGDAVLVKGSRGMKMETVIEAITHKQ